MHRAVKQDRQDRQDEQEASYPIYLAYPVRTLLLVLLLLPAPGCLPGGHSPGPVALPPAAVPGASARSGFGRPSPHEPSDGSLPLSSLGPLPQEDPLETLIEAARRLHRIRSIRGFIDKTLWLEGQEVLLRIRFFFARPGRIRYEHLSPVRQTILRDGEHVWVRAPEPAHLTPSDKDPSPRPWSRHRLEDLSLQDRSTMGLSPGYGLDPLAPLPVDAYSFRFVRRSRRQARIRLSPREGSPSSLMPLDLHLDLRCGVVTRVRFYQDLAGSQVQGEVGYFDFREALPGVYFPAGSHTVWYLDDHVLRMEERFRSLLFNQEIPEGRFEPVDPCPPQALGVWSSGAHVWVCPGRTGP